MKLYAGVIIALKSGQISCAPAYTLARNAEEAIGKFYGLAIERYPQGDGFVNHMADSLEVGAETIKLALRAGIQQKEE